MRRSRWSISRLMLAVGVVGLNLWALRVLHDRDPWLPAVTVPVGVVVEVAVYRFIRTRGKRHAFWAGFLIAGSIAVGSAGAARLFVAGTSGTYADSSIAGVCWRVWFSYFVLLWKVMENLPSAPAIIVDYIIVLVTELLVALGAGLVAMVMATCLPWVWGRGDASGASPPIPRADHETPTAPPRAGP